MRIKKFIASILAAMMTLSVRAMPALAADKSASTALTADVSSGYSITVPESVTMTSTTTGAGTYTGTIGVNIKGDIATVESVILTASAPTMTTTSGESVKGSFSSMPKTKWTRTDMANSGTTSNYIVKATLTPGSWKGTATFTCTLCNEFKTYSKAQTNTYSAPVGYTFAQFIDSSFNSGSFYASSSTSGLVVYDGFIGTAKLTDVIVGGATYTFDTREGG